MPGHRNRRTMRRRRLLVALAATGGTSLLSGCGDRESIGSGSSVGASTRSAITTSTTTAESDQAADCPPVAGSVVCSGTTSPDTPVVLVPTVRSVSLAGEFVGFTLRNRSESEISFRPYGWRIWRRLDRWGRVDEGGDRPSIGETVLSPGGSYSWQVAVGPVTATADRPPVTVNDVAFEPGRYAFAVPVRGGGLYTHVATFDVTV